MFGSTQYNPPSRFLAEIPEQLVTTIQGERRTAPTRSSGWGGSTPSMWGGSRRANDDDDWSGSVIGGRRSDESTLAPPPPQKSGADRLDLKVNFPGVGQKQLLLAWAPLKKRT